jgi:branched-chain amino acid transport system substrate-binding protein
MKKSFLWVIPLLALAVFLEAKEIVRIGVLMPMSGDIGNICKDDVIVLEKRVEEINKLPETRYEYKLIFEDSKYDPKTSHLAASKLLFEDKVDALIPFASISAKVTWPLVERAKVPQITLAFEECANGQRCFTYYLKSSDIAELLSKAAAALGYKSYAVVGTREEGTLKAYSDLRKISQKYGIGEVGVFLMNPGDTRDYRIHLLKARETKPDFYFFEANPPDIDIIFRQASQLGGVNNIVGEEDLSTVADGSYLKGVWVSGCAPFSDEVRRKFRIWGAETRHPWTLYTYDLPKILIDAFEKAGNGKATPSGDEVCKALREMKSVETALGPVTQDDKGAFEPKPVLVYYDEKGQGREVSIEELKRLKGVK